MELEGKLWKHKKLWIAEVPALGVLTQNLSRKAALDTILESVKQLVLFHFPYEDPETIDISLRHYPKGLIGVAMTDNKLLLALSLRRQREQSGLTIREAAQRLGSKSPNAYAQYERGKIRISLDKFERLLQAANPYRKSFLRIT
jgi:hypothetical protein